MKLLVTKALGSFVKTHPHLLTRGATLYFQATYKGLSRQQCARHLQGKHRSCHNKLLAGAFILNKPTNAQTGMFIPNKLTYEHGHKQSSPATRKPHKQSQWVPANCNSAASYLTQARMLKIDVILLNNASITVIPLNVTQTTVTWLSGISTTVAQSSNMSKATTVPLNKVPTVIVPSNNAPTVVVQLNNTPATPLSSTFASSSNTKHHCPTQC